jgi:hypothetical protein
MSALFEVKVDELRGTRIELTLVTVHPDAGPFRADAVFALRVLFDPAFKFDAHMNYSGTSPLGDAMTYEQSESEGWMHEHASRFVAAVTVEPTDFPQELPIGTKAHYAIEATDAKWLEHLSKGQTWKTAAYSLPT